MDLNFLKGLEAEEEARIAVYYDRRKEEAAGNVHTHFGISMILFYIVCFVQSTNYQPFTT